MGLFSTPVNPYLGRWMLFVDGENLLAGAQVAIDKGLGITEGDWYRPDQFVWIPPRYGDVRPALPKIEDEIQTRAVRAYFYATARQNDMSALRAALWSIGFQPQVFQRKVRKDGSEAAGKRIVSKGVDIALATDVLSNAFAGNFDAAVLFAGDADYVPLVQQVKRLGRRVILASFSSRLSQELRLESDRCYEIDEIFEHAWLTHLQASAPPPVSSK